MEINTPKKNKAYTINILIIKKDLNIKVIQWLDFTINVSIHFSNHVF